MRYIRGDYATGGRVASWWLLASLALAASCGRTALDPLSDDGAVLTGGTAPLAGAGGGTGFGGSPTTGGPPGGGGEMGGTPGNGGAGGTAQTGGGGGGGGTGGSLGQLRLAVLPREATVQVGRETFLRAVFEAPTLPPEDVTTSTQWSSQTTTVASAGAAGRVVGNAPGTAEIQATFRGLRGSARVTVLPAEKLTSITIDPAVVELPPGALARFQARGIFSGGTAQDITAQVNWRSEDPAVASLADGGANVFRALAPGKTLVVAELDGIQGRATFAVTNPPELKLSVDPATAARRPGETLRYRATAITPDGLQRNVTNQATWITSNEKVATVARGGAATCQGEGIALIAASWNGAAGNATLTCEDLRVVALRLTPTEAEVPPGTRLQYFATAVFADSSTRVVTNETRFTSLDPALASVSPSGLATALAPGKVAIQGTWQGATGTATLVVRNR